MYKVTWDKETGGVLLHSRIVDGTIGVAPRPVFFEELDMLGLDKLGWTYPRCPEPLLWAVNKQYWYRGELVFEAKGANLYDDATVVLQPGKERLSLEPVNVQLMLERTKEYMFLLESEAIEFIHETFEQYAKARKSVERVAANRLDYEALAARAEKQTKRKMAIVKEDCDSFDIMPLTEAESQGKRIYQTTKIDRFIASFSGGKDSQVVLDLCTRAIPSTDFEVIYSDTGYELPSSLKLYDEVQRHYKKRFPDLKFSTARNHETVLNYWDKLGTPSNTHRWCCSVMKTAPLYRMLKIDGSNKQAKVLTFDGVRAEESLKRENYIRIGKGKHTSITNAHPILQWNTVEIFLYLFRYNLPINMAYRNGKARVGCVVCPFSSSWDDMVATKKYSKELEPFLDRITEWAKFNRVGKPEEFLKERKWKIKAIGNTCLLKSKVSFEEKNGNFYADVHNSMHSIYEWLHALSDYTIVSEDDKDIGSLKHDGKIYDFEVQYNNNHYRLCVKDSSAKLTFLLKRVVYKSAYCVSCEVCEVDCPTGALSIVPKVKIDTTKCVHCHKCLLSHDLGCISADCVRMIRNMNNNENTKIQAYKTFGFREEWLQEYFADPEYFWKSNSLGSAQVDGFKAWLKDAEINDAKNHLTCFGKLLQTIYVDNVNLTWELILTNLSYHSFIVNWFVNHVPVGHEFDRKILEGMIKDEGYSSKGKTISNAVAALVQTFDYSPLGDVLNMGVRFEKNMFKRNPYFDVTNVGIAYCLYRYAESKGTHSLRLSDFYNAECTSGPFRVLGVDRNTLEASLKSLNSAENRVLIAELSMGLDSITLRDDLTALSCVESLIK